MGTLYAQPEDLWIHAAPPSLLFGDANQAIQGIDPGIISDVTLTQTGSGSISVSGIPRGTFSIKVLCHRGGEINSSDVANPGTALPQFRLSSDDGITYSHPVTVSDNRDVAVIEWGAFGLRFEFRNGMAAPSFVAGDVATCTTMPSADIIAGLPVVCAFMDKYLVGSFDLPLTEYPPDFTAHACDLLRWRLLKKIGIAERQDMQTYRPDEVMEWLREAREGKFVKPEESLGITETGGGTSVQAFVPVPGPNPLCGELPI